MATDDIIGAAVVAAVAVIAANALSPSSTTSSSTQQNAAAPTSFPYTAAPSQVSQGSCVPSPTISPVAPGNQVAPNCFNWQTPSAGTISAPVSTTPGVVSAPTPLVITCSTTATEINANIQSNINSGNLNQALANYQTAAAALVTGCVVAPTGSAIAIALPTCSPQGAVINQQAAQVDALQQQGLSLNAAQQVVYAGSPVTTYTYSAPNASGELQVVGSVESSQSNYQSVLASWQSIIAQFGKGQITTSTAS